MTDTRPVESQSDLPEHPDSLQATDQSTAAPPLSANPAGDFWKQNRQVILLALILVVASFFRFVGTNWDEGGHLHPDERFLTLVATEISWPGSFSNYMDVYTSPLSPYNTEQYKSYVYGAFPLFVTKAVAGFRGMDEYGQLNLVGRQLSAVLDIGNLILVYLIGNRLFRRPRNEDDDLAAMAVDADVDPPIPNDPFADLPTVASSQRQEFRQLGLYSAALYACTVFAIQQSHFFTVDNFESFAIFLSFFFLVKFFQEDDTLSMFKNILLASIALGFALAAKMSAILFLPIIAVALGFKLLRELKGGSFWRHALVYEALGLMALAGTYVTTRLFNPYMFATNSWTDITLNEHFQSALDQQRSAIKGEFMFPPQWQWVDKTAYWFPLSNYVIWGLGPAIGLLVLAAIGRYVYNQRPSASATKFAWATPATLALVWIFGIFLYRGGNFVKTMRYFLYLVPFMVLFASYGLSELKRIRKEFFMPAAAIVLGLSFLWALAFTNIYRTPTTRVAASNWIFENIPSEAVLANEHWDDGIPVWFDAEEIVYYNDRVEVEVYGLELVNDTKIQDLYADLSAADYVFVTSNRASGTIGKLPKTHPLAVSYYDRLDDGSLGYELEKKFTSYPSLFGLEISDESAEEAFWVYDHPTVRIYKKVRDVAYPDFASALIAGAPEVASQ